MTEAGVETDKPKEVVVDKSENPRFIEFYDVNTSIVTERPRKLLREYSGIPDEEIEDWIAKIVSSSEPRLQRYSRLTNSREERHLP
jgi:hypothetical protein